MVEKKFTSVQRLVLSGMFLALCMVLPLLGGNAQPVLNKISPMHFPVMICGYVCGGGYGLVVGFIAPLLRSVIFGMPPMMPTAAAMSFELAVYGLATGLLYRMFPKKTPYIYVTLIIAMLAGRIVWGLVSIPLYSLAGKAYSFHIFITNGFINAILAIVLQILIIPTVILVLKRAKLL